MRTGYEEKWWLREEEKKVHLLWNSNTRHTPTRMHLVTVMKSSFTCTGHWEAHGRWLGGKDRGKVGGKSWRRLFAGVQAEYSETPGSPTDCSFPAHTTSESHTWERRPPPLPQPPVHANDFRRRWPTLQLRTPFRKQLQFSLFSQSTSRTCVTPSRINPGKRATADSGAQTVPTSVTQTHWLSTLPEAVPSSSSEQTHMPAPAV